MRFLYFYLMGHDEEHVRRSAADHAEYWRSLDLPEYLGGPFVDRTGGLITFDAADESEARSLVRDDPFVREGLILQSWVTPWATE
jgi:uncharacterized protein YciI